MTTKSKDAPASKAAESIAYVQELVPASQFTRYPQNRHVGEEAVQAMKASIYQKGILQAIIARPVENEDGTRDLQIVCGETRWLGARAIDENYLVPVVIRPMDDKEAAMVNAHENFQRQNLNEIEEARALKNLKEQAWSTAEIAAQLGRSEVYVTQQIKLLDLPESGQAAVLEGAMSKRTAWKVLGLPAEMREEAIRECVNPEFAVGSLNEYAALNLIDQKFVQPLRLQDQWNEKRALLERENRGCEWLEYEAARKCEDISSGYEAADATPGFHLLSDAAKEGELVVPTWEALARKHCAPIVMGCSSKGEMRLYVQADPLIDAEKAAHDEKPGDCIFTHEKHVTQSRLEAAQREARKRAEALALGQEKVRYFDKIGDSGKTSKTVLQKFVAYLVGALTDEGELASAFWVTPGQEEDERDHAARAAAYLQKRVKARDANAFEEFGRICAYHYLDRYLDDAKVYGAGFESGFLKAAEYPLMAAAYGRLKRSEEPQAPEEDPGLMREDVGGEEEPTL